MTEEDSIFGRTELLVGPQALQQLSRQRVIIFGVGGVGSWCAEALVRTGIVHLTMVDSDTVCTSNINRQLMATTATVGQPKVEVLRERFLQINPQVDLTVLQQHYTDETADSFRLDTYDYVIDAIDSLADKASLILRATATRAVLFSSMGAALKTDASRIQVTEFWKVKGDPLARALRQRFKKQQTFPRHKFQCVYSEQVVPNQVPSEANGTLAHITGIFGLQLAGLVINHILSKPIA